MVWSWWMLLYLGLAAVPLFFLWSALHEVSHYVAIRLQVPITRVNFWLYPHLSPAKKFYFARVTWRYGNTPATPQQMAWALFAPRWMNLLATLLFPLAFLFPSWGTVIWMSVWGAGLIDFLVGSIDRTPYHDMRRYSETWGISPWVFRIWGVVLILTSVILGFTLVFTAHSSIG